MFTLRTRWDATNLLCNQRSSFQSICCLIENETKVFASVTKNLIILYHFEALISAIEINILKIQIYIDFFNTLIAMLVIGVWRYYVLQEPCAWHTWFGRSPLVENKKFNIGPCQSCMYVVKNNVFSWLLARCSKKNSLTHQFFLIHFLNWII